MDLLDYLFKDYRDNPSLVAAVEAARKCLQENPVVRIEHADGLCVRLAGGELVQLAAPAELPAYAVPSVNLYAGGDSRSRTLPVQGAQDLFAAKSQAAQGQTLSVPEAQAVHTPRSPRGFRPQGIRGEQDGREQ